MNRFKIIIFNLIFFGSIFLTSIGWAQKVTISNPPVIKNYFAVDKGYYGYTWKIYLEAEDPDGDMLKIASIVDQPGYGRYFTDWIILKPEFRKYLKGYIQWNIRSSSGSVPEWTEIQLKISIIDIAGNESNIIFLPFTFESGLKDPDKYLLPPPFNQKDLPKIGNITIELLFPGGDVEGFLIQSDRRRN